GGGDFKAGGVRLAAVLLILDYYRLRRFGGDRRRWLESGLRAGGEKVPFFLVSLVFMGLAIAAKPQSRFSIEQYQPSASIAQASYGTWFYLIKTLVPVDMIAFYPTPKVIEGLSP